MKVTRLLIFIVLTLLLVSCGKSNDGDWFLDYKKTFGTSKEQIEKAGGIESIEFLPKIFNTAIVKGNNFEIRNNDKVVVLSCIILKMNEKNGIECISKLAAENKIKSLSSLYMEGDSLKFTSERTKDFALYFSKTKQDPAVSEASEKELIADGQKGPFGEAELVPQGARMGIEEDCASKK